MAKRTEGEPISESPDKTRDFVKKNWPIALVVTGTVVGAAVWLTARYLRKKKEREITMDRNLEQVENEAATSQDPTVTILENGTLLGNIAGEEVISATIELEKHLEKTEEREVIKTLGQVASIEAKNRSSKNKN